VLHDGDTLSGTITDGRVMTIRIATSTADTVEIENISVSRVLSATSGADLTHRYIDADLIRIRRARLGIDRIQSQIKAEVESGKRKKTDWTLRTTFALIHVKLERSESSVPELSLTLYNFGEKALDLFKARVYCLDSAGTPIKRGGEEHIFEASSPARIEPGEDFTTKLNLSRHREAQHARVQITYAEFADHTWWRGKMEMATF
jgi:hypothetical protein